MIFHSPNLLWQEGARGTDRIGLIDFQDTVFGPVAYDVASLTLDARTDMSEDLEMELLGAYVSARESQASNFDRAEFFKGLCRHGRAADFEDPRDLRAAGQARW
ncbi:phosphotransferase [Roseibium salinum]|nr:phosphotransferase [Roseibium salinum]